MLCDTEASLKPTLTDVLREKAADFVLRTAPTGQPFFMYIAPYAPHQPATPAKTSGCVS